MTDKLIPELKGPISADMMEEILSLNEEQQAILLGKDPDAKPAMDGFEKALRQELKVNRRRLDTAGFLETCYDWDVSFRQGWLVFQRLINIE